MKSGEFFRNARRSGLWSDVKAIHRSTLTKARRKLEWPIFEEIFHQAVTLAYQYWPKDQQFYWHNLSVYAMDGSMDTLPATEQIRNEFDPESGLQYKGKGHYPQCLVCTAYDVFRRLPVGRTIVPVNSSEREQAKSLLRSIPAGSVLLFDRGYPGYEFISYLRAEFSGHFIFRCPGQSTFPAVEAFLRSNNEEGEIYLDPSANYRRQIPAKQRKKLQAIRIRIIKLVSPDGTVSVLLTNLHSRVEFPKREIVALYFRRWEIESYFRDEKIVLELERFHGKTPNSIRQELFAVAIMTVVSRTLMVLSSPVPAGQHPEPQFKNAIMTLASEAALLVAEQPEIALRVFRDILSEISRVKYYRPSRPRPSQPRVTKANINKWAVSKTKKVANA